ncbi:FKBP-type peptidyl-prolyl cis-trans isomerase [Moraxella sp.]|uniref:FKBP-type peptidyl-prolyl cis-trans isomerase n=1 Tax=Moraxella sp. TaxID=479 RepID=UPI0026DB7946|nr:FKBP-type peptidyl-prolyl cis-trans isomerase [Moraxella sp.]MDO4894860.1 FKBP-type peptidyl-prolyl cis-trans isomerase [Moraxella sp.]
MTLIAEDIEIGTGKTAVKGALISTQYTGKLADGTIFDSSVSRGRAFECVIGTGRVIKGWDLGVLGFTDDDVQVAPMKVGGKRRLVVPAHLGYGERAIGKIPPNSTLYFEIELLEVRTRDD